MDEMTQVHRSFLIGRKIELLKCFYPGY